MEQRRFFEARGEESGEWLVLDGKRHPPRVICRCFGWNAPKNAALIAPLWRRTIRSSTQNSPSTVRGGSMSSQPSKHRARLNLRLHPSLQPESPGQGTGARRRFTLWSGSSIHQKPSFWSHRRIGPGPPCLPGCPRPGGSPFQPAANGWWAASFFAVTSEAFGSPLTARARASLVAR